MANTQAGFNYGPVQTFVAGGAITAYSTVKLDSTAGQVVVTTAITEHVVGVALQTVASGETVEVVTMPGARVKMRAAAAISLGAELMPKASGSGKVDTAAGATALSCGVCTLAAAADGDTFEAIFRPSVKSPANS